MSNKEAKGILKNMVKEFSKTMSKDQMLVNYKWFSIYSDVKNHLLTRKLLGEILK